jgi:hypothetical protein
MIRLSSDETNDLEHAIRNEISWYFSPDYLLGDIYLRRHMNSRGFLLFTLFADLPRLRRLTMDHACLLKVCKSSVDVEVRCGHDGVQHIRRTSDWQQWILPPTNRDTSAQDYDKCISEAPSIAFRLDLRLQMSNDDVESSRGCSNPETSSTRAGDKALCRPCHEFEPNPPFGTAKACLCEPMVIPASMSDHSTSEYSSAYDSVFSPKEKLVEQLMQHFRTSFYAHLRCIGTKSTIFDNVNSGNGSESNSKEPLMASSVNHDINMSTRTKRTRKHGGSDDFWKDERRDGSRDGDEPDASLWDDVAATTNRKLACPYYKHSPTRYMNQRSCPGPGWTTVAGVKSVPLVSTFSNTDFCVENIFTDAMYSQCNVTDVARLSRPGIRLDGTKGQHLPVQCASS